MFYCNSLLWDFMRPQNWENDFFFGKIAEFDLVYCWPIQITAWLCCLTCSGSDNEENEEVADKKSSGEESSDDGSGSDSSDMDVEVSNINIYLFIYLSKIVLSTYLWSISLFIYQVSLYLSI